MQLSNALSERPDAKVADLDELRKREGHLICDVETGLSPAAKEDPWRLRTFDDGEHGVQVNIANVTCVLFADENKQDLVDRLERTLLRLETKKVARCTNGKPIGARSLRDALRRYGFSAQCQGILGAQVANFTPTAQGAQATRAEREGPLICGVRRRPIGRMARNPHRVFEYDSLSTHAQPGREIYLANVDCSLYLEGTTRKEVARQLRAAFNELSRTSRG